MIITPANLRTLFTSLRTLSFSALNAETPLLQRIRKLMMPAEGTGEQVGYGWLGAVHGMEELKGKVEVRNLQSSVYFIRNLEWHQTIHVKTLDIIRDTYGIYSTRATAMGDAAATHPLGLFSGLLRDGFETKGKDYTGSKFFSQNKKAWKDAKPFHTVGVSGDANQYELSAAAYNAARANLISRTNAHGDSMRLGRELVLIVSAQNENMGRQILEAERIDGGNTNVNKGTADLMVLPDLDAMGMEDAWFLIDVGYPVKPFIDQTEIPLEFNDNAGQHNTEYWMLNHAILYQGYKTGNAGYGLPELAWGSSGDDGAHPNA